jgi:hypothetical protein
VYGLLEFEDRSVKVEVAGAIEMLNKHMPDYIASHSRKLE